MKYYYDLHIHSAASPCGDNDMTPNNIVNMSVLNELNIIAVSDHNTAANLPAVFAVAKDNPIVVVPAIEVCTMEEVHVLCLFYELKDCLNFSDYIYERLPEIENEAVIFGEQLILNDRDEKIGDIKKLLISGADISFDEVISLMEEYNGLAIPAHIDKNSNSVIANLGFIPPDLYIPCVEVKNPPYECDYNGNIISNSDAHYLEHISYKASSIDLPELSVKALIDTLKNMI